MCSKVVCCYDVVDSNGIDIREQNFVPMLIMNEGNIPFKNLLDKPKRTRIVYY